MLPQGSGKLVSGAISLKFPRSCYTLTRHSVRTVTEKYLMGLDKGNFTQNLHHLLPKNIAQESKSRQFEEKKKAGV